MQEWLHQKTVLVTGAAGFIGSHLVDYLLAAGATVYGVDNFSTGRQENLESALKNPVFHFIEADVTLDPTTYLPADSKLDLILHFASPASPPRYQAQPVNTYLVNSLATHHLLQYLRTSNPEGRFLFASTSEIYGDPQVHPQSETYWGNVNPNGVRSCYDEAKRLGETICGVHFRDFNMDVRIIRIFNTYGPRIDPADGRVIPQFITEALAGEAYSVFGDGSQTRSYCFVDDLVKGIMSMACESSAKGKTINLGNPEEHTVLDTAKIIHQLVHPDSEAQFTFKELPKDDPIRRKPDISLAQSVLHWQPEVSLVDGLTQTIASFKSASATTE